MLAVGAATCLAFHRAISTSNGTKDCARRAIATGIPTYSDLLGRGGAEAAVGGGSASTVPDRNLICRPLSRGRTQRVPAVVAFGKILIINKLRLVCA
jgi:hypothetical protein